MTPLDNYSRDQLLARIKMLEGALTEALEGYEYACEYKGEYFVKKHGDAEIIARGRAALGGGGGK